MLPWKPKPAAQEAAAGPLLVQAGAALAPQFMGAEGPHGPGTVQGHHTGLSPQAGGASREARSGRTLVPLSHSATDPKEDVTTSLTTRRVAGEGLGGSGCSLPGTPQSAGGVEQAPRCKHPRSGDGQGEHWKGDSGVEGSGPCWRSHLCATSSAGEPCRHAVTPPRSLAPRPGPCCPRGHCPQALIRPQGCVPTPMCV